MIELEQTDYYRLGSPTVDRSALSMTTLREHYPGVMERLPIAYTGSGENVFFEQFQRASLGQRSRESRPKGAPQR